MVKWLGSSLVMQTTFWLILTKFLQMAMSVYERGICHPFPQPPRVQTKSTKNIFDPGGIQTHGLQIRSPKTHTCLICQPVL